MISLPRRLRQNPQLRTPDLIHRKGSLRPLVTVVMQTGPVARGSFYRGCQKNVPIEDRFSATNPYAAILFSEHYYGKRYNSFFKPAWDNLQVSGRIWFFPCTFITGLQFIHNLILFVNCLMGRNYSFRIVTKEICYRAEWKQVKQKSPESIM